MPIDQPTPSPGAQPLKNIEPPAQDITDALAGPSTDQGPPPSSPIVGLRVVVRGEKRFFLRILRRSTGNHLLFIVPVERGATAGRVMATLENYLESTIWPHPDTRSRGRISKFFWNIEVHQGILSNFHDDDLENQTNPVEIILASHQFSDEFTAAYNHPGALRASAAFLSANDEHAALYENTQPRKALVMVEKLNREAVFLLTVADFVFLVVVTLVLAGIWHSWDEAMKACGQTAGFMAVLHGAVYFLFD